MSTKQQDACATPTRILLVGLGGYGNVYLEELFRLHDEARIEIVGAVEPVLDACRHVERLSALGVEATASLDEALETCQAELAILSTPIQCHEEQCIRCLQSGLSVLCEKPLAPTFDGAQRMRDAEAASRGFAAVGYQWSFSEPVLALKQDILAGRFGKPRRFRTVVLWPRTEAYFSRNAWAGRIALPDGTLVRDSPVNNAMAHYLHNMLFLLGARSNTSAFPRWIDAELYRANDIENYDTAALRCGFDEDVEALLFVSHAIDKTVGPRFVLEFEEAKIQFGLEGDAAGHIVAQTNDGRTHDYGRIAEYPDRAYFRKLWSCIDAVRSGDSSSLFCSIEAALPHAACVSAMQRSQAEIPSFDASHIERRSLDESVLRVVPGLREAMLDCFAKGELPSESHACRGWARKARRHTLDEATYARTAKPAKTP